MPTLSDIKEIYLLRYKIFTIRFFPLTLTSLVLLYIIATYSIFNKYFIYSVVLCLLTFLFSIFWIRFNQKIKYIGKSISQGKNLIAYQEINNLRNEPLLESESIELRLHQAQLFYQVGNFKRFLFLMDDITKDILKYPNKLYFYRLLNAFKFEIKNDFTNAIVELEQIIENTQEDYLKAQANNNIGRIEKIQGKYQSAQRSYYKAFNIIKQNPNSNFIPVFMHNLLMIYATNNEQDKAKLLLSETLEIIDKNNSYEMVEYINNITHYSRQINDKQLLEQSYGLRKNNTLILKRNEQFTLDVSELRMRYNDNNNFESHYKKVLFNIKKNYNTLDLDEKLLVIREFRHVLTQYIQTNKENKSKIDDLKWLTKWHISLENDILNKLNEVESSLSNVKADWLNQLVFLKKSNLIFADIDYLPLIQNIVQYLDEIINIWKDAENPLMQLNVLIQIMDEIISLFNQTQNMQIIELYKDIMPLYIIDANNLLEENWKKSGTEAHMIGVAFFSKYIINDKKIALKWIDRFDNLDISLNHYAEFIKREYQDVKEWLK